MDRLTEALLFAATAFAVGMGVILIASALTRSAEGHELIENAHIATTCVEWEHSVTEHRQDVFDAIEYAAYVTSERVNKVEQLPHEIAQAISLCVTDPENTDVFIANVSSMCSVASEDTRAAEKSLDEAVSTVSTDLFEFCVLSSMVSVYPTSTEEGF
jgi:hypothetical protein